jgi:sugar phosphate isomerase/epimerase
MKNEYSRRDFLGFTASVPAAMALGGFAKRFFGAGAAAEKIPVGLELYSVRDGLKQAPAATVRAVAKMGYQCVEFYAPYFDSSESQTKDMRKLLDDLGIKCYSTHNSAAYFESAKLPRARDLNLALGCKYMVMASSEEKTTLDQWKKLGDTLNAAADTLEPSGLLVGYHNHAAEFTPLEGRRPMEVLAEATKPSVMLQLDVGTCVAAGADPVAWIRTHPGRIRSIHCKDWGPGADQGYRVLFGEGVVDWKAVFAAAEHGGGVEYYLVEQEGSRFPELETAEKCLAAFRVAHAAA